jgi:hypothetical protein
VQVIRPVEADVTAFELRELWRRARCSGVTESRVSQLHSKAVLRLRSRLKSSG